MQHFYTAQNLLKYSLVSLKKHSTLAISYRLGFSEGMIATFCQNLIKFSQIVFHIHSSINSLSDLDRGYLKHDQNQPSPSWAAAEPGLATLLWFQGRSPDSQGYKEGFNTRPGRNETLPCVLSLKHAFLSLETMEQNYLGMRWASTGLNLICP